MRTDSVFACLWAGTFPLLAMSALAKWLARRTAADRIPSSRIAEMFDAWALVAFLTGMAGIFLPHVKGATTLLFVPLVIGALIQTRNAWVRTLSLCRQGGLSLHLGELPLTVGRPIRGHVEVSAPYPGDARVELTVSCRRHYYDSSLEFGHQSENVWRQKVLGTAEPSHLGTRVLFSFEPPRELPACSHAKVDDPTREYHAWSLELHGTAAGLRIEESYRLSVDRFDPTGASAPHVI